MEWQQLTGASQAGWHIPELTNERPVLFIKVTSLYWIPVGVRIEVSWLSKPLCDSRFHQQSLMMGFQKVHGKQRWEMFILMQKNLKPIHRRDLQEVHRKCLWWKSWAWVWRQFHTKVNLWGFKKDIFISLKATVNRKWKTQRERALHVLFCSPSACNA